MEKEDSIKKFLDKRLRTVPSTRKCYRVNIENYFRRIKKDMETYFPFKTITEDDKGKTLDEPITVFTTPLKTYEDDLQEVYTIIQKEGKPDLSIRTYFNAVKQFMITNDKRLKDLDFWENLKGATAGAEPESDEAILNAADIKGILSHGNACSRALFLILASSGRRISEILALTPDDINTKVSPTTINIRKGLDRKSTKTKKKTLCYITDEATAAYNIWMKERDEYLLTAVKRGSNPKDPNDPRVFPMSYHNALLIWRTLLMRAGLVEIERVKDKWTGKLKKQIKREHKGERTLQHPHCLRKFYRSYLGDADLSEYLMGHSTILQRTYRMMKPEDLAANYLKFMPNVTIFESVPDLSKINTEITELKKDFQKVMEKWLMVKDDNEQLREELETLKKKR